jgi:hypothetical protein
MSLERELASMLAEAAAKHADPLLRKAGIEFLRKMPGAENFGGIAF